ncbi:hypothetical protein PILCRDRAFT_503829 [Piloderma croceum F 1598]|uniref:SET domain-containing protein n=1 Tax=Piloderma croceum (strain F 1598) TaxID=765440 RepID=A0A0C3FPS0_PILCF|nr:hypothetical protein PILCRDRAFT_503829 [Piloderma croceum F 1598]
MSLDFRARTQKLIFHDVEFDKFRGIMLLDESVLNLLPTKPFSLSQISHPTAFETCMTTNKGLAMFATRDIVAGEIIHSENPAVVVYPFLILNFDMTQSNVYRTLFDRLDSPIRDQLLALNTGELSTACCVEEGIVRNNGFAIMLPIPVMDHAPESLHSGVFLDISRCNHSCNPNAFHEWDLPSFSLSISARRHIRAGEEITVAYVDPDLPRDERREKLKYMYNFDCECEICAVEDKGRRVYCPLPSRVRQKLEI